MSGQETIQPPFALRDNGHPVDILDGAAAVTRFLCDIAPHLTEDNSNSGISEKGAHGLWLILNGLEKTIEAAAQSL